MSKTFDDPNFNPNADFEDAMLNKINKDLGGDLEGDFDTEVKEALRFDAAKDFISALITTEKFENNTPDIICKQAVIYADWLLIELERTRNETR